MYVAAFRKHGGAALRGHNCSVDHRRVLGQLIADQKHASVRGAPPEDAAPTFRSASTLLAYDRRVVEDGTVTTSEGAGLLGPLEAEIMEVLWAAGEARSVRAVLDELNQARRTPLAYTTVMTVMSRL